MEYYDEAEEKSLCKLINIVFNWCLSVIGFILKVILMIFHEIFKSDIHKNKSNFDLPVSLSLTLLSSFLLPSPPPPPQKAGLYLQPCSEQLTLLSNYLKLHMQHVGT